MSRKTTARKRVKAVRRQDPYEEIDFEKTVDVPNNWDLDFKINENYQLTPTQVAFLKQSLQKDTRMCIVDGPLEQQKLI